MEQSILNKKDLCDSLWKADFQHTEKLKKKKMWCLEEQAQNSKEVSQLHLLFFYK